MTAPSPDLTIGVAGCGRMGLPMAQVLRRAGYRVTGHDVRAMDGGPVEMVADPAAFAAPLEVLITVVRDTAQTDDLLFGAQDVIARAPGLRYLVVSSTLSPRYVTGLRARVPGHIAIVDAPMSGAQISAQEARLSFMLGGPEEALDHLMPLFRAMGTKLHRMGPLGTGMTTKVLNNFVAASSVAATRTALGWADRLGVDGARLRAVMHDSSGQTWFGSRFEEIEFARDGFSLDNTIGILPKDVESALDALPPEEREGLPQAVIDTVRALKPLK